MKTVIFDLDGTLLNTLDDLAAATNLALQNHGLPALPVDAYRLLVGAGARNLLRRAASAAGLKAAADESMIDSLVKDFSAAYQQGWADKTRPYPGVQDMLDRLLAAGSRLAVLSNKPDAFTQLIVRHFFPDGPFSLVSGMRDGWPAKPDPSLALELCGQLGALPSETALVGDSDSDMQTAVRGGLTPVGVLWGFRDAEELMQNGACRLFADPAGLAGWLLECGQIPGRPETGGRL